MPDIFPPITILVSAGALACARFENQRWVRSQNGQPRTTSDPLGYFALIIGFCAMLFGFGFLAATGFDFGWATMIGLLIVTFLSAIVWSGVSTVLNIKIFHRPDNEIFWVLGTIAILPLVAFLATKVTWFGIFS